MINTADSTQIGTVLTLPGEFITGPPMLTANGTRALIVTDVFDGQKRTYSTRVAVINTVTGTQTGTTLTITDRIGYRPVLLSANGTHALLSYTTSWIFGSTTWLVVIYDVTGTQTASIFSFGQPIKRTADERRRHPRPDHHRRLELANKRYHKRYHPADF